MLVPIAQKVLSMLQIKFPVSLELSVNLIQDWKAGPSVVHVLLESFAQQGQQPRVTNSSVQVDFSAPQ
jgi:hypothetical protein